MICGIGTDIVEIKRLKNVVDKWGSHFLKRVFTAGEISFCYKKRDPFPHIAARFAAKEAMIKALGGLRDKKEEAGGSPSSAFGPLPSALNPLLDIRCSLFDIEILNQPNGKPFIGLRKLQQDHPWTTAFVVHLSMSHEQAYAVAIVILERRGE
ncbi:holo-ACP synthase [Thermodesulfovibrionales bacterium]|nr:holo-ACP synthase [Thermodesulfovibrionales bacterium]MCL0037817.1 holo-ACP synthase [Thermodesulfovibrionales bacterium]MCL0042093.1 holo-ACP synthase [Thermodesulfovibrionales bacterium]MCL0049895.1 holo-ACP synthase [Thermodesulfovibrionales bacterium]MCL0066921.1 holo-ACP synthase [Thermodesulfovibrionales bacterium]